MELSLLIDKIKHDKGLDLSGYKESTITRRIERRMQFDGASSLEEYIRMINRDHHLYWRLVSDFFIGVTDFFRDREIWEVVCEKVLPEIIESRIGGSYSVQRSAYSVQRENINAVRTTQYAVQGDIRQTIRFRKYDLTKPETLAGFDMVVCRNVLIYFQRQLQDRVLKNFYRALKEDGILWLGSAESLSGEAAKLFEPVYKNEKIFRKHAV